MSKRIFTPDLLNQAKDVLSSWTQIDDQLAFGSLNTAKLTMVLTRTNGIETEIRDLENRLTDLRNQRDQSYQELWDIVKRVRAGIKAIFGDDSSQFEMVGGTRISDRKNPRRIATLPAEPVQE